MANYLIIVHEDFRFDSLGPTPMFFKASSDRDACFKVALGLAFGWSSLEKYSEDTLAKNIEEYIEDNFDPEDEADKKEIRKVRRSPIKHFWESFKRSNGDGGDFVSLLLNTDTQKSISLE